MLPITFPQFRVVRFHCHCLIFFVDVKIFKISKPTYITLQEKYSVMEYRYLLLLTTGLSIFKLTNAKSWKIQPGAFLMISSSNVITFSINSIQTLSIKLKYQNEMGFIDVFIMSSILLIGLKWSFISIPLSV